MSAINPNTRFGVPPTQPGLGGGISTPYSPAGANVPGCPGLNMGPATDTLSTGNNPFSSGLSGSNALDPSGQSGGMSQILPQLLQIVSMLLQVMMSMLGGSQNQQQPGGQSPGEQTPQATPPASSDSPAPASGSPTTGGSNSPETSGSATPPAGPASPPAGDATGTPAPSDASGGAPSPAPGGTSAADTGASVPGDSPALAGAPAPSDAPAPGGAPMPGGCPTASGATSPSDSTAPGASDPTATAGGAPTAGGSDPTATAGGTPTPDGSSTAGGGCPTTAGSDPTATVGGTPTAGGTPTPGGASPTAGGSDPASSAPSSGGGNSSYVYNMLSALKKCGAPDSLIEAYKAQYKLLGLMDGGPSGAPGTGGAPSDPASPGGGSPSDPPSPGGGCPTTGGVPTTGGAPSDPASPGGGYPTTGGVPTAGGNQFTPVTSTGGGEAVTGKINWSKAPDNLKKLQPYIEKASAATGTPEAILAGSIWQESGGNVNVNATDGGSDQGLMQIDNTTYSKEIAGQNGLPASSTTPTDPANNIMAGATYLAMMEKKFGSWDLALRGYNSGENGVDRSNPNARPAGTGDPNYVIFVNQHAKNLIEGIAPAPRG